MTQPSADKARARLAAFLGYEPDEHDALFDSHLDVYRAAVLREAARAVFGRVEAYEGMDDTTFRLNRERSAIAELLRRMAEEARS